MSQRRPTTRARQFPGRDDLCNMSESRAWMPRHWGDTRMFRKVALFALAGVTAAGLFIGTADATAARVKGKFKVENSGSPVLGSTKVKPMGRGAWRVGTTLQHVWRTDYDVWVDSYVDAN